MVDTPEQRRQSILQWLHEYSPLNIDDLVSRLQVSLMTVHRDLDHLVKAGLVQKTYGRVELARVAAEDLLHRHSDSCAMCRTKISARTEFVIQLNDHRRVYACCCHCGLLLLNSYSDITCAMARDFIYCQMVNVRQAAYVVGSRVQLCCAPSILCFTHTADAQSFASGFGGKVMDFIQAVNYLMYSHHHKHEG